MTEHAVEIAIFLVTTFGMYTLYQKRSRPMAFLSFVNFIFLVAILPKILMYMRHGDLVFLSNSADFETVNVEAATLLILSFVFAINLAWWIPLKAFTKHSMQTIATESTINRINLLVILPVSLVAMLIFIYSIYADGGQLFAKIPSQIDGGVSASYIMQKVAQVSKIGLYMYFLRLISCSSKLNSKSLVLFLLVASLTSAVFLLSGHRSGVFILLLQVVLLLHYRRELNWRHAFWFLVIFAVVNITILITRDSPEQTQFALVNFFRRYFFEVEKISSLTKVLLDHGVMTSNPWTALISNAAPVSVNGSMHAYVGHDLLKSHSAVPPTVLGEIIIRFGGIAVMPLGFFIGVIAHAVERLTSKTRSPLVGLVGLTATALAMFLLLNTDTWAFTKRAAFELVLIGCAWVALMFANAWLVFWKRKITA